MESSIGAVRDVTRRMGGRDRHETHRVATPLELLFDLTFATSFGLAASHYADALAAGRYVAAVTARSRRKYGKSVL
jgi:hypothetical protein